MEEIKREYLSTEHSPVIDPELRDLLPPITDEEREALTADILKNGCYSPMICMEDMTLVDGHHRYDICTTHDIPYRMVVLDFEDKLDAMDTMMADAGASFQRLVSEIQTNQGIGAAEAETLAESVVYATIQEAIWHHQPAAVKGANGMYIGARMLQGSQDTMLLYSYLTKERAEYANYSAASIGQEIAIQHPADMTPTESGAEYVFGPFSISDNMLSAGDVQLVASNAGNLAVRFTDQNGVTLSSVREGVTFYVRASGVPTVPITITVQANTANAVTLAANRGRMYVPTDGAAVQPVGTGGVPKTVSASASLTLPTINLPAPPAPTGAVVAFKKTDAESGAVLPNAVIRIENAAGEKIWQGTTGADGTIATDVELLYDTDYTYYEVSAPQGYNLDSTKHTLRISSDGGNPAYWGMTNRLTVIDIPPVLIDVVLKKTDAATGAGLAGAKLKVMDANGTAIGVFTTGKDGTVTIPQMKSGSYLFSETEAPAGYTINKTAQNFAVSDTGVVSGSTTISNEKIKPSVTLKKVDEQGKPLEGATIKVLDASNKEVFSGKTDKDGKVIVSGLSLNTTYTYFESAAPAGYELNSTKYTFTVDNAGNMSKPADIVNKKIVVPTPTPTSTPPVIILCRLRMATPFSPAIRVCESAATRAEPMMSSPLPLPPPSWGRTYRCSFRAMAAAGPA